MVTSEQIRGADLNKKENSIEVIRKDAEKKLVVLE